MNFKTENEICQKGIYQYWFGTYNNPPEDWKKTLESFAADYSIGQLEKGENGTPHIQFLLYFKAPQRPSAFKGIPVWIRGISAKDAHQNVEKYVSKQESRIEGPHQCGEQPSFLRKRTPAKEIIKAAKEGRYQDIDEESLLRYANVLSKVSMFDDTKAYLKEPCGLWICGPEECGKTLSCVLDEDGNPKQGLYLKDFTLWWDGYSGQDVVLLDDMDMEHKHLGSYFKIWGDFCRHQAQCKGGYVRLRYSQFIVTSNFLPADIWPPKPDDERTKTFLRTIMRRFKFRIYYGYRKFIDGTSYGEVPELTEEQREELRIYIMDIRKKNQFI